MGNFLVRGAIGNARQSQSMGEGATSIRPLSQGEQLGRLEQDLELRLGAVREAIALLNKMPEIERLTTLL